MRFAENLIGPKSHTMVGIRCNHARLNEGEVLPTDGESINLYGKIAVLVAGQASAPGAAEPTVAPAHLDLAEAVFKEREGVCQRRVALNGGEGGIRTRGTLRYTAFPMQHNRPLCHLSGLGMSLMS